MPTYLDKRIRPELDILTFTNRASEDLAAAQWEEDSLADIGRLSGSLDTFTAGTEQQRAPIQEVEAIEAPVARPITRPARTTQAPQTVGALERDARTQQPLSFEDAGDTGAGVSFALPAAPAGQPPAMAGAQPSLAAGSDPEAQARAYRTARASGLDDEGARVVVSVLETEGGTRGAIGDNGKSKGGLQFHEEGEMPGFRAWVRAQGIQGDPDQLVHNVDLAVRYAAEGYLGRAIAEGRKQGLTGSALATYAQQYGQRSVEPERTGANYERLFGAGRPVGPHPTTPPPAEQTPAAQRQADLSAMYPRQDLDNRPDKWSICGPIAVVAAGAAQGRTISLEDAIAKATAAGWTPDGGMAGPGSQVATMQALGIKASTGAIDLAAIKRDTDNGNVVLLSSPGASGHYFVVQGVDDEGRLDLGNSALALRASGGRRKLTLAELQALGPIGAVDTAIYVDNPKTKAPSLGVAINAPEVYRSKTAGAPPPAGTSPAATGPLPPGGGSGDVGQGDMPRLSLAAPAEEAGPEYGDGVPYPMPGSVYAPSEVNPPVLPGATLMPGRSKTAPNVPEGQEWLDRQVERAMYRAPLGIPTDPEASTGAPGAILPEDTPGGDPSWTTPSASTATAASPSIASGFETPTSSSVATPSPFVMPSSTSTASSLPTTTPEYQDESGPREATPGSVGAGPVGPLYGPAPVAAPVSPYDADQPFRPTPRLGTPANEIVSPPVATSPSQDAIDPNDTRAVDQGRWESPRYQPPTTWYGRAAEAALTAIAPAVDALNAANEWLINNPVAGALNPQAWGRELGGTEQIYLETREDQQRLEALIRRYRDGDTSVEPEIQALTASLNRRTRADRSSMLAAGERNPDKTAETLGQVVQGVGATVIAPGLAAGPVRNAVGAALDPIGQGIGAGLEGVGTAVGAARGLGTRVRGALERNAENVARADARIAAEGSTVAPGSLGVAMGTDMQGMARPRVVPPDVADTLDFPIRVPEDPAVIRAIEAAGGSVDPARGVDLNVIRYQGPEAHGRPATRSSTFYTADKPGAPSPYAAGQGAQVGGTDRIEAPTRFRSPLVLSDAPGANGGFDQGMDLLGLGERRTPEIEAAEQAMRAAEQKVSEATKAYAQVVNAAPYGQFDTPEIQAAGRILQDARTDFSVATQDLTRLRREAGTPVRARDIDAEIKAARRAGPAGSPERARALKDLVNRYGGDESVIDDLLAVRGADDSESAWAIKENILAHNARRQGYDGVLTVQQNHAEFQTALESAVKAHPDYQAQLAVVDAAKARLDASTATPWSPAWVDIHDAYEATARKLDNIHDRLIDEVDVPVPSKITELMDVREGANPTPGSLNPVIAERERAIDRIEAITRDVIANPGRSAEESTRLLDELTTLRSRIREIDAEMPPSERQRYEGPPGYTLRPDIKRRGGETTASGTAGVSTAPGAGLGTRLAADVGSALGSGTMGAAVAAGTDPGSPQGEDESDADYAIRRARERAQRIGTGAAVGMVAGPLASRAMRRAGGALATPGVSPGAGQPRRRLRSQAIPGQLPITSTPAEEVSRLRLDKFPEEVRADIEAAARDQDWARTQRRGVLPDAVVQQMAQDDIASVDRLIKGGRAGKAYSAEETLAVRNAVASQANIVRELSEEIAQARAAGMAPELLIARRAAEATKLNGLVQIAEGARAEAGRTLRAYRQQANLIEMDPGMAVERIYKRLGGRDNATEAVDEYTRMVQDGADPIQLAKFWARVEAGKITGSDLFALYRRFNMLSGPRTVEVNALSGVANLAYEVASQGVGQGARLRFGEGATEVAAPFKAGARAFRNMAETIWHGVSTEQALRGDIPRTLSSRTDNPVAKGALTVMEIPDRLNAGVDQFFRTMTEDWAATRLAHEQARAAGVKPRNPDWAETVAKHLEAIRDDPSKFPRIKEMADRVTFSEEPGGLVKGLEDLKRKSPNIVGFILPFIRTPANIASRAVDLSPLGPARTVAEAATGLGRGRANLAPRVRDNVIGTAAALWAYNEAQQGNITGAGPDDPEKVAALRATGWQPYSIKIGDRYWSYANFAPFSLALSTGAAAHEAQKYAKPGKSDALSMLSDGAERTGKVVTDMTVLAGLGAVVKSIQDPDRYGSQWLTQALTQLIPAGSALNTVGQAMDPNIRRAERDTFGSQVGGGLLARIPPNPLTPDRTDVPIAQDPLGRPIPNEQTGFGALNPFRPTTERTDPALQPFIDAGVDIGKPKDTLTIRPGTAPIELTPAEARRWNELRGAQLTLVAPQVGAAQSYRSAEKGGQQMVLRRILTAASESADRQLIGEIGRDDLVRRMREAAEKKKAS